MSSPSVVTRRYGRALEAPNATILGLPDALAQPVLALLAGRDLDIITTGGSSAAGAGGVGVANTFPALLTKRLNEYVAAAPGAGRARNFNMAHGDTNSLFAAMTMDSHFPAANGSAGSLSANEALVLWEYSINNPVANFKKYTEGAMRFFLAAWLRGVARVAARRYERPPTIVLTYLWSHSWKRRGSVCAAFQRQQAFEAQAPLLAPLAADAAWQLGALNVGSLACTLSTDAAGSRVAGADALAHDDPLRSLSHWVLRDGQHPTRGAHALIAEVLLLLLTRKGIPPQGLTRAARAARVKAPAKQDKVAERTRLSRARLAEATSPVLGPFGVGTTGKAPRAPRAPRALSDAALALVRADLPELLLGCGGGARLRELLRLVLDGDAYSFLSWPPTASLFTGRSTAADSETDSLRLAGQAAALSHVRVLHDESAGRADAKLGVLLPCSAPGLTLRVPPGARIGALVWLTVGAGMFTAPDEHPVAHTLDGVRVRGQLDFWRNATTRRRTLTLTLTPTLTPT